MTNLTRHQLKYAAFDVIAGRAILEAIQKDASPLLMPAPKTPEELVDKSVWLLAPQSSRVVAVGTVIQYSSEKWGRLHIKSRAVIKIDKILIPAVLCTYHPE